MIEKKVENN